MSLCCLSIYYATTGLRAAIAQTIYLQPTVGQASRLSANAPCPSDSGQLSALSSQLELKAYCPELPKR
ncbi:MAG: hypothetical protein F6J93_35740 [Oscillatoria sp. SIO1A7]|nr:hypothetical protein [Oscillatoria sp. SIO1A7]